MNLLLQIVPWNDPDEVSEVHYLPIVAQNETNIFSDSMPVVHT